MLAAQLTLCRTTVSHNIRRQAGFPLEQAGVLKTGAVRGEKRTRGERGRDIERWDGGWRGLSKNNEMCRWIGGGGGGGKHPKMRRHAASKSHGFNGLPPPFSCAEVSCSARDRLTFQSRTLMLTLHDLFGCAAVPWWWWWWSERQSQNEKR